MEKEDFNIIKSIERQKEYCGKNNLPHFAPRDGVCWACHRNIYSAVGWKNENGFRVKADIDEADYVTGVTTEKASNQLITGCTHCNRTYCD